MELNSLEVWRNFSIDITTYMHSEFTEKIHLLPPANEVWGKVIFLHLFVCHSVHRGVCLLRGDVCFLLGGASSQGVLPPEGVLPPAGVCFLPGGASSRGCLVETPPGRLLLRAVRILLKCILVFCLNFPLF